MKVEIGPAWIARDEDGSVWQYDEKPIDGCRVWIPESGDYFLLNTNWLPGVPWNESCRKVKLFAEVVEE